LNSSDKGIDEEAKEKEKEGGFLTP